MEHKPILKEFCTISGHRVELAITKVIPEDAEGLVGFDDLDNDFTDDIAENIELGEEFGTFSETAVIVLADRSVKEVEVHGEWKKVPDFDLWRRVFRWSYNRNSEQSISEEMFCEAYGNVMGRHYFSKWLGFDCNIEKMVGYLDGDQNRGQKFMAMVMEKVLQYEQDLEYSRLQREAEQQAPSDELNNN